MKKTIITGLFLLSSLESAFSSNNIPREEEEITIDIRTPEQRMQEEDAEINYLLKDILLPEEKCIFESLSQFQYRVKGKMKGLVFGNVNWVQN
jgi:hypothetical protein